jgi:predicted nicotinamide N-methyase
MLQGEIGDEIKCSKVVELGSGCGLAGLCAAALGCHVLLTDVPAVAANLQRTLCLNAGDAAYHDQPPDLSWPGAVGIGRGSAAVMRLDWREGVEAQLEAGGPDPRHARYVLACEAIWLADLVEPFVRTVSTLLHAGNCVACYMTYTVRGHAQSSVFSRDHAVLDMFHLHACRVHPVPSVDTVTSDNERVLGWQVTIR